MPSSADMPMCARSADHEIEVNKGTESEPEMGVAGK
jgi:hypothetical protein